MASQLQATALPSASSSSSRSSSASSPSGSLFSSFQRWKVSSNTNWTWANGSIWGPGGLRLSLKHRGEVEMVLHSVVRGAAFGGLALATSLAVVAVTSSSFSARSPMTRSSPSTTTSHQSTRTPSPSHSAASASSTAASSSSSSAPASSASASASASTSSSSSPSSNVALLNFAAGLVAGIAVDVPLHPLDTIKTRLQAPAGFAASGGFRNVWGGLSPVLLRSLPCSAIFFVTYDQLRSNFTYQAPFVSDVARDAVSGSAANVAACSVRVPCEVLKQRLQAALAARSRQPTLTSTIKELMKEGPRAFYCGFGATVSRELSFAAIQMPLFEMLKKRCTGSHARTDTEQGLVGALAGGISGAVAGALTTPMDVVKTRAMLHSTPSSTTASSSLNRNAKANNKQLVKMNLARELLDIFGEGGLRALFRGAVPRTVYVGASCALSFGAFEWSKALLLGLQSL